MYHLKSFIKYFFCVKYLQYLTRRSLNLVLIKKNETVLLLTPISNKRYIKNEEDQIFVILENYSVKIINHVYSYTVILGDKSWNSVVTLFDSEVESRRNKFEKEITSNIKYSIKKILEKI